MANSIDAYRAKVLKAHRAAFEFHGEILGAMQRATSVPRTHRTLERLVHEMLMLQCFKSHATVSLLAQHGLMEDTATICRRLLELSVTTVFIGADDTVKTRKRRCGMYMAFMWRQLPRKARDRLPANARRRWSSIAKRYARLVPTKAKRWGPNFFDMFKEIGQEALYRRDYSFLSAMAHGNPENQLFTFAAPTIRVHDHRFASVLLVYSTKYFLATIEQWNQRFRGIPKEEFTRWVQKAANWDFRASK